MIALLAGIIIPVMLTQTAQAKSLVGDNLGKANGISAHNSGQSYDTTCPGSGTAYCAGYTVGYAFGWELAKASR